MGHFEHSAGLGAEYPIGTVALYGPDDKITTKIVAAVILEEDGDPILKRWVGTKLQGDPKVARGMRTFFTKHRVKRVVVTEGNLGCPHEEGPDFPVGGDFPFCPFWKGKQGTGRSEQETVDQPWVEKGTGVSDWSRLLWTSP